MKVKAQWLLSALARVTLLGTALVCAAVAQAQGYPSKPIRVIMALSGGAEIISRLVAQKLTETLGQPLLIEIQGAAAGAVGAEMVARAAPDGYTLLLAGGSSQIMRPHLTKNTPYDPIKDFTPITRVADAMLVVLANPSVSFGNLREMVEYAKKNPGKLSYGTSGVGTIHHLSAELIRQLTDINMVHVPYKTAPQVVTDLLSGQIPVGFSILATTSSHVKSGKVKVLAMNNSKRYYALPDIATVTEQVPGYEPSPSWMGYFGPAGLPRPVLARLHTELVKALAQPEIRAKADGIGFTIETNTPEEFAAEIKRDLALVGRIVKAAGIQPED